MKRRRLMMVLVLIGSAWTAQAEEPSINSILLGAKPSVGKAAGFGIGAGETPPLKPDLADSNVLLSPPVVLQLDPNAEQRISEIGFFDHEPNPGATNFFAKPTEISVPNDLFPGRTDIVLHSADLWGMGSFVNSSCDAEQLQNVEFLKLLAGTLGAAIPPPLANPFADAQFDQLGEMCHVVQNFPGELQVIKGICDALAKNNCNPAAPAGPVCAPLGASCQDFKFTAPLDTLGGGSCAGQCEFMQQLATGCAADAPPCTDSPSQCQAKALLCKVWNDPAADFSAAFPAEHLVLADVRDGAAPQTVVLNGEAVSPYAGGLPIAPSGLVQMLHGATVYREGVGGPGNSSALPFQNVVGVAPVRNYLKAIPASGNGLAALGDIGPSLVHYTVTNGSTLALHDLFGGLVEPVGVGSKCQPFEMDAKGQFKSDAQGFPFVKDTATLFGEGCAAESDPIAVRTGNFLGGGLGRDLLVVNRGTLANGHAGFVTGYRYDFAAQTWHYAGFVAIGAEPYGAAVVAAGATDHLIVTSAASTPAGATPPYTAQVYQVAFDPLLQQLTSTPITVADVKDANSEFAGYVPYDVTSGNFDGDGKSDFALTWVKGLDDVANAQFAPFFTIHLATGDAKQPYAQTARYYAPATKEDGGVFAEAGGDGTVTKGAAQCAVIATGDPNRDGRIDLLVGNQHPYTIDGARKVFVHYYRGFGNGLFDEQSPKTYQVNKTEEFLLDDQPNSGGVRQIIVDQFQNLGVLMGPPVFYPQVKQTPPPPGALCGNGITEPGEQCDDGNVAPKDGCGPTCLTELKPDDFSCVDKDDDEIIEGPGALNGTPFMELPGPQQTQLLAVCTPQDNCSPEKNHDAYDCHPTAGIPCANNDQADQDKDGVGDVCDNCVAAANPGQESVKDNDDIADACDNCPDTENADQKDFDKDGIGDACDTCKEIANPGAQQNVDKDKDGIADMCDKCPDNPDPLKQDPAHCVEPLPDPCKDFKDEDGDLLIDGPKDPAAFAKLQQDDPAKAAALLKQCVKDNCSPFVMRQVDEVVNNSLAGIIWCALSDPAYKPASLPCVNDAKACANIEQKNSDGDEFGDKCEFCIDTDCDAVGDAQIGNPANPADKYKGCPDTCNPGVDVCIPQEGQVSCWNPDQNRLDVCRVKCGSKGANGIEILPDTSAGDGDHDFVPAFFADPNTGDKIACDNCFQVANLDQLDADGDGTGDVCELCPKNKFSNFPMGNYPPSFTDDDDGDGVINACDNCFEIANANQTNSDNDALGNVCDNCNLVTNVDQQDTDGDDIGNVCDTCTQAVPGGPCVDTSLPAGKPGAQKPGSRSSSGASSGAPLFPSLSNGARLNTGSRSPDSVFSALPAGTRQQLLNLELQIRRLTGNIRRGAIAPQPVPRDPLQNRAVPTDGVVEQILRLFR